MGRVFALIALICVAASAAAQECPPDLLPLTPAIVKVQVANRGGTGTLIWSDGASGLVLTCHHVVRNDRTAIAYFRSGYRATGEVVATGQAYDTAIVKIQVPPNAVVIPVAEDFAPQGATVHGFGYGGQHPRTARLVHFAAPVNGYVTFPDGTSEMTMPDYANRGDSGGPLIYNGAVVGVISRGNDRTLIAPHSTPIRNLLRAVMPHVIVRGIDAVREEQKQSGFG
jgi:hypothetical protein